MDWTNIIKEEDKNLRYKNADAMSEFLLNLNDFAEYANGDSGIQGYMSPLCTKIKQLSSMLKEMEELLKQGR